MNVVKLSICIPTYNRLGYLTDLLDVLLPQINNMPVEVCVSDNASSDNTCNYLHNLTKKYSFLKYKSNKKNIGIDENMFSAISMGIGDYIYPLGDDDLLPSGTLSLILSEINSCADVIILNGWHTDPFHNPKTKHLPNKLLGKIIKNPQDAFVNLWDKMPFGSFLAKRECFNSKSFEEYFDTSHAYTGVVWDKLLDIYKNTGECMVVCMIEPTVYLRGGDKTWKDNTVKIMLIEIPMWFSIIRNKKEYNAIAGLTFNKYRKKQTKLLNLVRYGSLGQLYNLDDDMLYKYYNWLQITKIKFVRKIPVFILLQLAGIRDIIMIIFRRLFRNE
ncbi:glycosyltransferase family 2 protein [Endozoicomonas atrinae]|uniref:glycosyltransferase family 2 protein n=1 Tax=Endozoicomonas atrinae TaxID=1333660 RepID=UPI003B0052AC